MLPKSFKIIPGVTILFLLPKDYFLGVLQEQLYKYNWIQKEEKITLLPLFFFLPF